MIEEPLVSVLIFAYNHENYIEETINSVVCQKCSFAFEILVSDDFSIDNTLNIINRVQLKHPEVIRIISNKENLGLNTTFSNAVKNARGKFIALLGGDDYWIVDDKLEMQVQLLLSKKEIAYVHTEYKSLNESDKVIQSHCNKGWNSVLTRKTGKEALVAMLSHEWKSYPLGSSSCFRREPILKGINRHSEILDFNMVGEGTIVHVSMTYYGGLYAFIPVQTTLYRIRKNSLSHYENKSDQFDHQKKYFLLRLFAAQSCGLNKKEIEEISRRGLFELINIASELGTIIEFKTFLRSQGLSKCKLLFYNMYIDLLKSRIIWHILKVSFMFRSFIKRII